MSASYEYYNNHIFFLLTDQPVLNLPSIFDRNKLGTRLNMGVSLILSNIANDSKKKSWALNFRPFYNHNKEIISNYVVILKRL